VAYFAYDFRSDWVNLEVWTHAGAWAVFQKNGVYSMHFNRLTSHYTQEVPLAQTMVEHLYVFPRSWERQRQVIYVNREDLPFWNVFIIRYAKDQKPFIPIRIAPEEVKEFYVYGRLGLVILKDELPKADGAQPEP
jgi:hypothetical protein